MAAAFAAVLILSFYAMIAFFTSLCQRSKKIPRWREQGGWSRDGMEQDGDVMVTR